jgi:hypothetical protein
MYTCTAPFRSYHVAVGLVFHEAFQGRQSVHFELLQGPGVIYTAALPVHRGRSESIQLQH